MVILLVVVSLLLAPAISEGRAVPATTVIHSEDGDVIDCVDIYKQPALQHPLLKDHVVKMKPSSYPEELKGFQERLSKQSGRSSSQYLQVWQKSGSCPDGSIPSLRQKSFNKGRRIERSTTSTQYKRSSSLGDDNGPVHEYAITMPKGDGNQFCGGTATLQVWNPTVEVREEFSASRVGLQATGPNGVENIFAGYHVYPLQYGDNATRLYIDWSIPGQGCYNLLCPGFIQVDRSIVLGGQLAVSSYGGEQMELNVHVYKEKQYGDWWLMVNGTGVGYWRSTMFNAMKDHVTHVEWGGEILNTRPGGRHTMTQMGNGHFPGDEPPNAGKSAYFGWVGHIDCQGRITALGNEETGVTNANCYNYRTLDVSIITYWQFLYGGPGGSDPNCK